MGKFNLTNLFGMTIRESANDGSDFTNPDADYRRLFLGEDGLLYVKDSAGTVTHPYTGAGVATDPIWAAAGDLVQGTGNDAAAVLSAGASGKVLTAHGAAAALTWETPSGGAPTTAQYIVGAADGGLSAEIARPELLDFNASGATPIDFSAASTGTGVTLVGTAGWNAHGKWTTASSINYLDVASAIGTGNFDVRARTSLHNTGSAIGDSFGGFFVTDGSRTSGTMLGMARLLRWAGGAVPTIRGRTGNTNTGSVLSYPPTGIYIQRIRRSGTTYIYEVSFNEGASWLQIETGTSALNVAKVGFWFDTNSATALECLIDWVRSY